MGLRLRAARACFLVSISGSWLGAHLPRRARRSAAPTADQMRSEKAFDALYRVSPGLRIAGRGRRFAGARVNVAALGHARRAGEKARAQPPVTRRRRRLSWRR